MPLHLQLVFLATSVFIVLLLEPPTFQLARSVVSDSTVRLLVLLQPRALGSHRMRIGSLLGLPPAIALGRAVHSIT